MVIVMLGAGTKAGMMDRGCRVEVGLSPHMWPLTLDGQAKGFQEDRAMSWEEAGWHLPRVSQGQQPCWAPAQNISILLNAQNCSLRCGKGGLWGFSPA